MSFELNPPELLHAGHDVAAFACGESSLNDWLKRRALPNQTSGASRTFVVGDRDARVMGYYALAAGAVSRTVAPGQVRRNVPEPVPVLVLGRLAVDNQAEGIQLGGALLRDAVQRTGLVAENTGVRALLVHALHERAKNFYLHYGFMESPIDPLILMLKLE